MNETRYVPTSPQLGLVCITTSDAIRFKTITRKRLLQFAPAEQAVLLRDLYRENLKRLAAAIIYCQKAGIRLYRLISNLLPFADTEVGAAVMNEFAEIMGQIGQEAIASGIRLVIHPDQFVVLNSDRPEVIKNSITILTAHARILDLLQTPQSQWTVMNIHGGKGDRANLLVQTIRDLPDNIRLRLTLENDEYAYGVDDLLPVCQATGVPIVFDAHHHAVHEKLESYDDESVAIALAAARTTWAVPEWQLVHISNGCDSFTDPHHSDYITAMPHAYREVPWIEVEAKQKEKAIAKLRAEWLPTLETIH